MFDTPQDIVRHLSSIIIQSVQSKVMPPGNITQMTDEERALIGTWAAQERPEKE